VKQIRDIMLW